MQHITDDMIDAAVSPQDAQQVLLDAFISFGQGRAAMQERVRTEADGIKLSTLGAVIPEQQIAGAKVYTTIKGQFSFVILLFSTVDGQPLASFDAQAITRLRTAACSVIAARHLARADARRMALFGAGVQGRAHAQQMAHAFSLDQILVCDPYADPGLADSLQQQCDTPVRLCGAQEAVADADIVVTASRSVQPLFDGDWLKPGTFVAAIGSSLPHTRELDDRALQRASLVAVEWLPQTRREAGELVQAAVGVLPEEKLVELGALVTGQHPGRRNREEITLYKSVGVGLEDVALAGFAYRRITQR
jgi:ornithine cyclodeaminase